MEFEAAKDVAAKLKAEHETQQLAQRELQEDVPVDDGVPKVGDVNPFTGKVVGESIVGENIVSESLPKALESSVAPKRFRKVYGEEGENE